MTETPKKNVYFVDISNKFQFFYIFFSHLIFKIALLIPIHSCNVWVSILSRVSCNKSWVGLNFLTQIISVVHGPY